MVADLPENYRQHDDALQFIRDVPVDWADTKCLDAVIGDYVVIARQDKHSDAWYVGAITDGQARDLCLSLDFLDDNRTYQATIYRDGDAAGWDAVPTDYVIEQQSVTSDTLLELHLAPGGGFAIAIK
jgi:alpha-glucosidase